MGAEELHAKADEPSESYRVIVYAGAFLPDSYRPFIYSKWLRSLRYGNDYMKLIEPKSYYFYYHRFIEHLLKQVNASARLAVLGNDPDVVLGFSLSRGSILDYVYVHKDFRKQHIGTKLIPKGITSISHLTNTAMSIWASKYDHWIFNPFT